MFSKFLKRDKESAVLNINIWFKAVLCLTLPAAILRALSYITSFDSEIGYFNNSFFVTLVNWLMILVSAFALCGFIYISKGAEYSYKFDNGSNTVFFAATFAGFIMLADFAYKLLNIIGEGKLSYYKMIFSSGFASESAYLIRVSAVIEILGVFASVLSAVCFFVRSSRDPKRKLSAWLGFFPIIRALVGVAQIYFDMTVQMNHPSKLMLQFALIAAMFYFLCEEREYVSDEHARPRRFFVFGCLAFFLTFVCGVSEIVGFFAGRLNEGAFCIEAFFCFVISFYILARTNSFVKSISKQNNASPEPEPLAEEELGE